LVVWTTGSTDTRSLVIDSRGAACIIVSTLARRGSTIIALTIRAGAWM
jgi:hypothetical protein